MNLRLRKIVIAFALMAIESIPTLAEIHTGSCGENATYTYDTSTGVMKIEGKGKMYDYESAPDAPWYNYRTSIMDFVISEGITSIGVNAIRNCKWISSINIPNSITSIGDNAFAVCSNLTEVNIPNSVTYIGKSVFDGCSRLNNPVYNDKIFAYLPTSYSGDYTIPEGISTIAGSAFSGCSKLTHIDMPNSLTNIDSYAFNGCM